MQEAEYDMTAQALGHGSARDVSGLYARFFKHADKDEAASIEAGRPIFRDVDYIEIRTPGNNTSVINRPVRPRDLQEFPQQWQAFQNQQTQPVEGTPLEEWPLVTRGQVEELKYYGVHTVEQLAQMSDTNAQNFMGLNMLRQKARDFMAAAQANAPLDQIRHENQVLRDQIAVLKDQISQLGAAGQEPENRKVGTFDDAPMEAVPVTPETATAPAGAPRRRRRRAQE